MQDNSHVGKTAKLNDTMLLIKLFGCIKKTISIVIYYKITIPSERPGHQSISPLLNKTDNCATLLALDIHSRSAISGEKDCAPVCCLL
jgi:hypothetical protein